MKTIQTRHLSRLQYRGLQKLGDAFAPGDAEFPSFSACGCAEHVDILLDEMPETDLGDLKTLLLLLAFLPVFGIRVLLRVLEWSPGIPGGLGAVLRLMRFGMKGLVVSLYYSGLTGADYEGKSPTQLLGYDVGVYTADLDGRGAGSGRAEPVSAAPARE